MGESRLKRTDASAGVSGSPRWPRSLKKLDYAVTTRPVKHGASLGPFAQRSEARRDSQSPGVDGGSFERARASAAMRASCVGRVLQARDSTGA